MVTHVRAPRERNRTARQPRKSTKPARPKRPTEAGVLEAIAIARDLEKLHARFDKLGEATPAGHWNDIVEPEAEPHIGGTFTALKNRLWEVARTYASAADTWDTPAVPRKGVRS